tara:strand:- start:290 stop:406 length:117 start_codon:yes stop_codon:yes gene_type:complete
LVLNKVYVIIVYVLNKIIEKIRADDTNYVISRKRKENI